MAGVRRHIPHCRVGLVLRWPSVPNPVYRARYPHLTNWEQNKLTPTQAQTVIAAAILRQLHAVITTGRAQDPDIAAHGTRRKPQQLAA